jgi:hypothetical protein
MGVGTHLADTEKVFILETRRSLGFVAVYLLFLAKLSLTSCSGPREEKPNLPGK